MGRRVDWSIRPDGLRATTLCRDCGEELADSKGLPPTGQKKTSQTLADAIWRVFKVFTPKGCKHDHLKVWFSTGRIYHVDRPEKPCQLRLV